MLRRPAQTSRGKHLLHENARSGRARMPNDPG
jgi:hypothetical protein